MSATQVSEELVTKLKQVTDGLAVDRVCGDRILVATVEARTDMDRAQERSNLIIPDTAKAANQPLPSTGIVSSVGPGKLAQEFREGEAVMFSRYAGSEVSESETEGKYRILDAREVLCVLKASKGKMADVIQEIAA